MLALVFSLLVFAFWTVLGRALLSVVYPRLGVLRAWLLAPAAGLSVLLLGLMVFNQAGLPIRSFALPLTLVLAAVSLGVLIWRKPCVPARKAAPFFLALLTAWLWIGWPAFENGFRWISYANDDMANYCLAAQRFMDHGFSAVPTQAELAGKDYAAYFFFMHVADMMRFGAEHVVAWSACLAGVPATQAFMPSILALALTQISAAGALVLHTGRNRLWALVTVWLLAVSPLFMLGTLYQLIAQVGGVALLLATVALLLRPWVQPSRGTLIRYSILPAITSSALCIFYPEVTPFAVLTFGGFVILWAVRHRRFPTVYGIVAAYTLLGVLLLLRHNVISYVSILLVQASGAMNSANLLFSMFPYFMLPTVFSNVFGWMPLARDFPEPILSLSVAAGMCLFAAVIWRSLRDSWRLTPVALLFLAEFALAVRLFIAANDFGLYKLAMWMQPMLLAGVAGLILSAARRNRALAGVLVLVYAATAAPTALHYTEASRGNKAGGLTELRLASKLGLEPALPEKAEARIAGILENVVAAKFAASELRGRPLSLLVRDYFNPTMRWDFENPPWAFKLQPHFAEMKRAKPLIEWRNETVIASGTLWDTQFTQPTLELPPDYYISLDPRLSLFNKFTLNPPPAGSKGVFVIEPAGTIKNRLLFVHSGLGNHYYLGDRRKISFFQQEEDLYAPGRGFNGIGRFLLLRIENPSPKVFLRIAATRTLATGRTQWDPGAKVRGDVDLPLGAKGGGAFNLFVGPLVPRTYSGANYVAIDFAETPEQLIDFRSGLKRLYNQEVRLDYRRLVGWARDVSALSEEDYRVLERPRAIAKFPEDLSLAKGLEFSGAYEDGWLSPHCEFVFRAARPAELLRVRGAVPQLEGTPLGTGMVEVTVNGKLLGALPAQAGPFDWLLPVPRTEGEWTRLELRFTVFAPLPGKDMRPAAAQLEFAGLVPTEKSVASDYTRHDAPRLAGVAVDPDGWIGRSASVLLPSSDTPVQAAVELEYPGWAAEPSTSVTAKVGDVEVATATLRQGERRTLQFTLPPSADPGRMDLSSSAEFTIPAPDSRRRALRLLRVQLTPSPKA